jgi:hypothetical protein
VCPPSLPFCSRSLALRLRHACSRHTPRRTHTVYCSLKPAQLPFASQESVHDTASTCTQNMHQAFPSAPSLSVGTRVTDTKLPLLALPTIPNAHKYPTNYSNIHPPVRTSLGQGRIEEGMGAKFRAMVGRRTCLGPRGHGSARTCSSTCRRETCTLSPAGLLQSSRRDPLRDKIREVGRP